MSGEGTDPAFQRKRSDASCGSGKTQDDDPLNIQSKPARQTRGLELVASPELLQGNEWRESDEPKKTSPLRKPSSKRFGIMPTPKSTPNIDLPTRRNDEAEKSPNFHPSAPDIEAAPASGKASRVGIKTRGLGSLFRQTGRRRQSSELTPKKVHSLSFRSKDDHSDLPARSSSARLALESPVTIRDRRPNQRRVVEAAKSVKFAAKNEEMGPKKKHRRAKSTGSVVTPTSIMKASSFVGAPVVKQPLSQAFFGDFLCNSVSHSDIHNVSSVESRNRSLSRLRYLSSSAMPDAVSRCRDGVACESENNLSAAQQRSGPTTPVAKISDTEWSCSASDSPKSVANDLLPLRTLPSEEEDDDVDLNTIENTLSFEQRANPSSNSSDDTPRVTNQVGANLAWLRNCVTDCAGVDGPPKESDPDLTVAETSEKNISPSRQKSFESEIEMAAEIRDSPGAEDNDDIASCSSRTNSQKGHNDEVISSCPSNVELGLIKEDEGDKPSGLQAVHLSWSRATSQLSDDMDEQEELRKLEQQNGRPTPLCDSKTSFSAVCDSGDSHPYESIELDANSLLSEEDANVQILESITAFNTGESLDPTETNEVDGALGDGEVDVALDLLVDTGESVPGKDEEEQFVGGVDELVANEPVASCDLDRHQVNDAGGSLVNDASPSTTMAMNERNEFENLREFGKLRCMDKLKELGLEHVKNSPNSAVIAPTNSDIDPSAFGVHPVDLFRDDVLSEPLSPVEEDKSVDLHRPDATQCQILNTSIDDTLESNSLSVDCSTLSSNKGAKSTRGKPKSTPPPSGTVDGVGWDNDPACNGLSPVIEMLDYAFGEDDESISDASSCSVDESDTSSFVRKKYKMKQKRRVSRRRYSRNSRRRHRWSKSSRQDSASEIDLVYSPILEDESNKASKELEFIVETAPNRDYLVSFSPSTIKKERQTSENVDVLNAILQDAPLTTISASAGDDWDDLPNLTTTRARARSSPNPKASKSGETAAVNAAESSKRIDRLSRSFRKIRTGNKDQYIKL